MKKEINSSYFSDKPWVDYKYFEWQVELLEENEFLCNRFVFYVINVRVREKYRKISIHPKETAK